MVGFCSGGGTPLFNGTEAEIGCDFFSPQSEYRPVEYLQQWCRFWFDDNKRLNSAKTLQLARLQLLLRTWNKFDWEYAQDKLTALVQHYQEEFTNVKDSQSLLAAEGRLTAKLYALANQATLNDESFKRESGKEGANQFLDHGNYLAYGLGATACWVLGLPHGLAILHGKTRRGGLVFDAADIIKDAIILPQAFISAQNGDNEKQFRQACINNLIRFEALDIIINTLKQLASEGANI